MPAATTHVEFARDVYAHLPEETKAKITSLPMFYLGSQGPDMLFFSRASLLPGSLKKYGNLMHDECVKEVISHFEAFAGDDPDLTSYICGYLCHYSLDSLAHPLICAVAKYAHETTGIHEGEAHIMMEGDIDTWILHQRGREISSYDVYKYLKVSGKDRKKLGAMYSSMFKSVFDLQISEKDVARSASETALLTDLIRPSTARYKIVSSLEDMIHMPHTISGMMLKRDHEFSVLNLEKKTYALAYDPEKTISSSFPELYGKALYLAVRLLKSHSDEDFRLNFVGEPI